MCRPAEHQGQRHEGRRHDGQERDGPLTGGCPGVEEDVDEVVAVCRVTRPMVEPTDICT